MSEQIELPTRLMNIGEFMAWYDRQRGGKYELVEGLVRPKAQERISHVDSKALTWLALRTALQARGLRCYAFIDGAGVRIDDSTLYLPDVVVTCGERPGPSERLVPDPVIVVEVASPSTGRNDAVQKFRDYFRLPTLRHYLLVDPDTRLVLHHRKAEDGKIGSSILGSGPLALDPPGITIAIEQLFEE